jgi:hypothetical protein
MHLSDLDMLVDATEYPLLGDLINKFSTDQPDVLNYGSQKI